MTASEQPPAPSPQRLDPRLRQPADGPVERDLSRAAAGVHHHRARAAGDGARARSTGSPRRPPISPSWCPAGCPTAACRRKPWIVAGYGLAALSKPLFPLAASAPTVMARALRRPHRQGHPRQPARRDDRRRNAARDPRPRVRPAGRRSTPSARCSRRSPRSALMALVRERHPRGVTGSRSSRPPARSCSPGWRCASPSSIMRRSSARRSSPASASSTARPSGCSRSASCSASRAFPKAS